jgi:MSHA biogenesis protein MshN
MSLLNDMLCDLTHHQKSNEIVPATQQAEVDVDAQEQLDLFYNTRTAKPLPRTLIPTAIIFILVLAILSAWKFYFFAQLDNKSVMPDATNSEPAPVSSAIVMQPENQAVSTQPNMEPARPDELANPAEEALGDRIAALESAITTLSTVIANTNLQTPAVITSEAMTSGVMIKEPMEEQAMSLVPGAEESLSVSIQEPFSSPSVEQGDPHLSIAPNVKWKDEQQAQQARQLFAQGQSDFAIETLQHFIAAEAQPRESVKALLDIYLEQENTDSIQQLLEQAGYLSIVEQTFYAAKLAVLQQQDTQAIQLLEAHQDEAEKNENYRALLAGLYQRSGLHVEAANHYRRLLNVFGEKPAYWLGFALSQDALNQPQVAVQAFQRVNQYTELQPQVRTYIQQRIAALQQ